MPNQLQDPGANVSLPSPRSIGRLHVIIDARPGGEPIRLARLALRGGAPVIQIRAKGLLDRDLYEMATGIAALCRQYGATCIVNDRADIAQVIGADGVHLGAEDLPVMAVRQVLGKTAIVGATARDAETGRRHQADGADYLGVGPIYSTSSKEGLPPPIGVDRVREVVNAVEVPVIAIAGVTLERIPEVLTAGVHGVAVVSAVANAADLVQATRELLAALERQG